MAGLTHYKYIDALRGFAFLGVLSVHASQQVDHLPGIEIPTAGKYGVQLFFLLSAITLLRSVSVRSGKERYPLWNFFVRRLFRIAPLFWFGILLYVVLNGRGPRFSSPHGIGFWHIFSSALFMHGWTPVTINSVVPGGWSIAVEMTFYLFLPFLAQKITSFSKACTYAFTALIVSTALNIILNPILTHMYPKNEQYLVPVFLFYWFPTQLPIFLMGFMVYYALHNPAVTEFLADPKRPILLLALSICGLAGLIELTPMESGFNPLHIAYAIMFSILIVSLAAKPLAIMVNSVTSGIGMLSFSCYINHFAILKITHRLIKPAYFKFLPSHFVAWGQFSVVWIVALLLTVGASALTYLWIEKPGMKLGSLLIRRYEGERKTEIQPA